MAVILEGKWRYGVSNSLNSGLLSNTPITSDDNNCGVFARSNNGVTLFIPNRFLENPIATRGNLRTIHAFKVLN